MRGFDPGSGHDDLSPQMNGYLTRINFASISAIVSSELCFFVCYLFLYFFSF